ncbi:MAG: DUF2934 domain-containing protein [Candidatus Methylacidiphilales bacterium]|nr:DUF2934 domain-containing protein [Candidatus Methylacidiphilales bacterium]
MNLHIMLTPGTVPTTAPFFSSICSLPSPALCTCETFPSDEAGTYELGSARWQQSAAATSVCYDSLPMRDVEIEPELSHEAIANLAYLFWLQDGSPEGRDKEHWAQAELFLSNLAS